MGTPGAIAQLGERLLCKQEVTGSIPVGSTSQAAGERLKDEESAINRVQLKARLIGASSSGSAGGASRTASGPRGPRLFFNNLG